MSTLSFTIAPKTIKYITINKIKEVEDLYNENLESLKKEIEKYTKKWKNINNHGSLELIY